MGKKIKHIAIITPGDDSPGMNAAIYGISKATQANKINLCGIRKGFDGLISGEIVPLDPHQLQKRVHQGGTMLKTSHLEFPQGKEAITEVNKTIKNEQIDALIVVGGYDTFRQISSICQQISVPVIGIPATIDNDLEGTDYTIGFDTAVNTAIHNIDNIRDTAESHNMVFLVEVMGSDSGYLSVHSGLGIGADGILIPESYEDFSLLLNKIANYKREEAFIVVISEGDEIGIEPVAAKIKEVNPNIDLRMVKLGHVQRGGRPSAFDRMLGIRLGVAAVRGLLRGKTSAMVGLKNNQLTWTPLRNVVKQKRMNEELEGLLKMFFDGSILTVEKQGILLSPTKLEFENNGVLNPGILQEGDDIHIFYRAVQDGNFSTVGYAKMSGPEHVVERHDKPLIVSEHDYERHGVEDPRIVKIDDLYYMTYTAYDGTNAMGALAVSKDLVHFEKKGIITPPLNYTEYKSNLECCNQQLLNPKYHYYYFLFSEIGVVENKNILVRDKDVVLFPRKINGQFVMLHRLWPGIQVAKFDQWEDLTKEYWIDHIRDLTSHIVLDPFYGFEVNYVGAGGPPIETEDGWLIIYHGVCETSIGKTYHAAAALLDLERPEKVLARLRQPLFSPTEKWELEGIVNYVVFPTGSAQFGDDLYIFYGAADKHTAVAKLSFQALMKELKKQL